MKTPCCEECYCRCGLCVNKSCPCHASVKEGWEQVWADFTNQLRSNAEVKEFLRSILASDRADLLREIEEGAGNLPKQVVKFTGEPAGRPRVVLDDVLTLIRSHMKE